MSSISTDLPNYWDEDCAKTNDAEEEKEAKLSLSEEDFKCPITLYRDPNVVGTRSCHHIFSRSGISTWLKSSNACPLCKKQILEVLTSKEIKKEISALTRLYRKLDLIESTNTRFLAENEEELKGLEESREETVLEQRNLPARVQENQDNNVNPNMRGRPHHISVNFSIDNDLANHDFTLTLSRTGNSIQHRSHFRPRACRQLQRIATLIGFLSTCYVVYTFAPRYIDTSNENVLISLAILAGCVYQMLPEE